MKLEEVLKKGIIFIVVVCMVISGTVGYSATIAATKKPVLNKKKATIYVGEKVKLKLKHAKAKKVKWKSSNKKVATVKKGVVRGKKNGKVTIYAKYKKKTYKAKIRVKKPALISTTTKLTLNQGIKMVDSMYNKKNIVVSPASLNIVLGMAANGATKTTKKDIEQYLGKTTEAYNEDVKDFISNSSNDKTLNISDSVWYRKNCVLNPLFELALKNKYNCELYPINMVQDDVPQINKWVSDKTDKMIPMIIKDMPKDTVAILINTILFYGKWTYSMKPSKTFKKKFTQVTGKKNTVEMMSCKESVYFENDKACGFEKTYGKNAEYSFIGVLPKKTGDFKFKNLELEELLKSKTTKYIVDVQLPKFDYDWDDDGKLNQYLKNNGLASIYDKYGNPLGNIFANSGDSIYASTVLQKCKITVDEDGTKAAAATAMLISKNAVSNDDLNKYKEVHLDRPFAYMIKDNKTGQILFVGKVVNP